MTNPPADAVGLSGGPLLAFGLVMLRQLIVMYLISLGAIVIGGIGGTMATAVYLAMVMTAFSPMAEFLRRCGRHAETCSELPTDFPELPLNVCDLPGVCAWLLGLGRDLIGVVGLCGAISSAYYVEGAVSLCAAVDRLGQAGTVIGVQAYGGLTKGTSFARSVLAGLHMSRLSDLRGPCIGEDFTAAKRGRPGIDISVCGSTSGVSLTFGLATGEEETFPAFGGGLTLEVVPTSGKASRLEGAVRRLARFLWDDA